MKIAILLGEFSLAARPLNFNIIFDNPRGCTGTDLSFCVISTELQKLGNEIHMFAVLDKSQEQHKVWENCNLHHFEERITFIDDTFDSIITINEPDALRGINSKAFKITWQFLNDWDYCQEGFDNFVDYYLGVCEQHVEHVKSLAPQTANKWGVLPLGCNPSWYESDKKIPGRMIYCSSADRGLHWALQIFPEIKKAVPEATLKVFYHFQQGDFLTIDPNCNIAHPHCVEMANRLRYCREAINKMKHLGVEHVGSVSVNQMKKEMSEASLLLFPVDTVSFSEGFSLSILQSHAAGLVPAISSADCIGSIYKDSGCIMVDAPIKNNLKEYTQKIIKALKDQTYANDITTKCKSFANKYLWTDIAKQMQEIIKNKGKINISDIASSTIIPVAASITPTIVIEDPVITSTKKVKLNIGCGPNLFVDEGWLNYDREPIPDHFPQYFRQMPWYNFLPHQQRVAKFYQEGGMLYFMTCDMVKGLPQHTDNSVDFIYKGQIIEHYNPIYQLPFVLQECYRVLKPGGIIRMTTPDLDLLINAYKNNEMSKFNNDQPDFYKTAPPSLQLALLMYGASGPDCRFDHYEGHYCLYNQESMTKILTDAGFKDIVYYYETGISKDMETVKEVWDHGMSHSFIVEATK